MSPSPSTCLRVGALILGSVLASGAASAPFVQGLAGAPFNGTVVAHVRQAAGAPEGRGETGTGSARFIETAPGGLRLELVGSVRKPGDTGFRIDGVVSPGGGWRGQAAGWSLAIADDGRVSGGGIEAGHRLYFSGKVSAEHISLHVSTERLQAGAHGQPAGSVITFDYALRRPSAELAAAKNGGETERAAARDGGEKNCKRTVWQTRNVTTPLGGMFMTQVPVCVNH